MDLLRLEQQRHALEFSLQELRGLLKHWQTWEAEYEGFKEEIQAHEGPLNESALTGLSKSYRGELVTEKEIRDLAALGKSSPRTSFQIIDYVEKRQDYVRKNIETTQRRYWDAEAKLEELDFVAVSASRNANNLPLTEIYEELDDDDNVISSSVSHPETSQAKLLESLKKAGLSEKDLPGTSASPPQPNGLPSSGISSGATLVMQANGVTSDKGLDSDSEYRDIVQNRAPIRKKSVSFSPDTKAPVEPVRPDSEDGRKSVSFASKVAVAPAADPPDTRSVSFAPVVEEIPAHQSATASHEPTDKHDIQKELRAFFKPGDKVGELNDEDQVEKTHVIIPENESEEDARTRREMLEYHLNEVGHVVAQIDLDEADEDGDDATTASDFTSSEYLDEDTPFTSDMSESEEEEDEFGRTKKRVISDDYHKQMKDLERRLIGNLGPTPTDEDLQDIDSEINPQDVRRLVIRDNLSSAAPSTNSDGEKKPGNKKRVSFAESVDMAAPQSPPLKALKTHEGADVGATFADPVSESKSFMAEASMDYATPSGPPGMVIADQLMERSPQHAATAPSIEEPDAIMQRRELAAEYYRRRNDMIRQQGGFKSPDADLEEQLGELMEEKDGKLKKVSRFKAARLRS